MKAKELQERTDAAVNSTKEALQAVYDALNHGQQKKLLKNQKIRDLFELYKVETGA